MCVLCLAAQRSLDDCDQSNSNADHLALDVVKAAGSGSVVTDHTSILYYLDGGDNFRWNAEDALGASVLVTYSFSDAGEMPSLGGSLNNPYGASSFSSFTFAQRNNFRLAANEFMAVSGIVLVEVEDGADIDIYNANGTNVGGYADLPYVNGSYQSDVDLVIDSSGSYAAGSYGYFTMLHELGHALGLDHTHEGAYTLSNSIDSTATTVMSYNYDSSAVGLQSLDVDAMQHLYGGRAISAGWSINYQEGRQQLAANGSAGDDSFILPTMVDGGSLASKIMGHEGNDTITGQSSVDILRGNKGDDYLHGMAGNDKLRGGGGADTIYGGSGNDFIHGGSDQDTIYGGSGQDTLIGGAASDAVYGEDGNDYLLGLLNPDTLAGGAGQDTLDGGRGSDNLTGGGGTDTFVFLNHAGHDTITDFDASGEILRFEGTGFGFSDVTVATVDGHAQVQVGAIVIDLLGVSAASIGADDFVFV